MGFDLLCSFDTVEFTKSGEGDDGKMVMHGWASTPDLDSDGERIIQEGLVLDEFVKSGFANWNHKSEKIIGIPRLAEIRKREDTGNQGLYTEIEMLSSPFAKEIYELSKALSGTGRSLGMSLEGKKLEVGKGGVIKKAKVMNVAITPNPKNKGTSVEALVKAVVFGEEGASSRFTPLYEEDDALGDRVSSLIAAAMTKALDAGTTVGGTNQSGGAAVRREAVEGGPVDLVSFNKKTRKLLTHVEDGDLKRIGGALAGIADSRGGHLTKAECALYTFLVDTQDSVSLVDCFKVFGLLG